MYWNQNRKEAPTMLRINVKANCEMEFGDKVKCSVFIKEADGVIKPLNGMTKDNIDNINWSLVGHFELEKPGTVVDKVTLLVKTEFIAAPKYKATTTASSGVGTGYPQLSEFDDFYESVTQF